MELERHKKIQEKATNDEERQRRDNSGVIAILKKKAKTKKMKQILRTMIKETV